ncbi:MAG: hypothetical protein IIT46_05850 [Lachnospiraceae bacterium]|nr:hypothetical protein [Lachnospiraceae bacterium]
MLQAEAERMTMQEQSKGKHEKSIIIQVSESDFISLTSDFVDTLCTQNLCLRTPKSRTYQR